MEMKTDTWDGILNFYNLHHRHHLQIRMSAPLPQLLELYIDPVHV